MTDIEDTEQLKQRVIAAIVRLKRVEKVAQDIVDDYYSNRGAFEYRIDDLRDALLEKKQ